MNRKEAIHTLKDIFDYFWIEIEDRGIDGELTEIMEVLEKPITLADFLGWREEKEYICKDENVKYKIKDRCLYENFYEEGWEISTIDLVDNIIKELQQATKVEKKLKAYYAVDEYSFNCLIKELEEQEYDVKHAKNYRAGEDVIYIEKDGKLMGSGLSYYAKYEKDKYDLIKYHKEEPLYYAIDRIGKLDNDNSYYLVRCYDEFSKKYYYGNIGKESADKRTKTEWNKLGINDTNADFEKVED